MAYGVKYYYQYKDAYNLSDTFKIELLLDEYASTQYAIQSAPKNADKIQNRGQTPHEWELTAIRGNECTFTFTVLPEDAHKYDEIATSDYKDWKFIKYKNSTKIFEGYVKPEHFDRGYVENGVYFIRISATCGLGDLKGVPFVDSNEEQYTDRVSILTILKRCIQAGDLPELDFRVQLNTYETSTMATTDCALEEVTVDCRRFYENEDGQIVPWKCDKVIEQVLKSFHVRIEQIDGYWWIVNPLEKNSYYHEYAFATLTGISSNPVASDLRIDITTKQFRTRGRRTWIRPLKKVEVKFENKNLGDDEGTNGDFELGNTTGFTNDGWDLFLAELDGANYHLTTTDNTNTGLQQRQFYADSFTISTYQEGDKLAVKYKVRLDSIQFDASATPPGQGFPFIWCGLELNGDSNIVESPKKTIYEITGEWIEYIDYFPLTTAGQYVVYFYVKPNEYINSMRYHWDDIEFIQERQADEITFDRVYINTSQNEAFEEVKVISKFGDSFQNSDVGAFKVGGSLTALWNRYGQTDNLPILRLLAKQMLNNFQAFGDSYVLDIQDDVDTIRPHSTITLPAQPGTSGSEIDCEIIAYSRNQRTGEVNLTVRELQTGDVTYIYKQQLLTSIDGQKSGISKEVTYIQGGVSYWRPTDNGIYTLEDIGIGQAPSAGTKLSITGGFTLDGYDTKSFSLLNLAFAAMAGGYFSASFDTTVGLTAGGTMTFTVNNGNNLNVVVNGGGTFNYNGSEIATVGDLGAYWPLSGTETLTGNVTIDADAFGLSIYSMGYISMLTSAGSGISVIDDDLSLTGDVVTINANEGFAFTDLGGGVAIEVSANQDLDITTSGTGTANYNGSEIATVDDLGASTSTETKARLKVTATDLEALSAVATKQLLAAPGSGYAIKLLSVTVLGNADNGYNRDIQIKYDGGNVIGVIPLQNTSDEYYSIDPDVVGPKENAAIILAATGDVNALTSTPNDLYLNLIYEVIQLGNYTEVTTAVSTSGSDANTARLKVTSADILTIDAVTDFDLLASPGAGYAIKILGVTVLGYASGGYNRDLQLKYESGAVIGVVPIQNSSAEYYSLEPDLAKVEANAKIVLGATGSVSGGTNDLYLNIQYRIIQLSDYTEL